MAPLKEARRSSGNSGSHPSDRAEHGHHLHVAEAHPFDLADELVGEARSSMIAPPPTIAPATDSRSVFASMRSG